jgi:hypothetical protein
MKNEYFGYQMNMKDTKQSISDALQSYYKRFGMPPQILEVSDKLQEVPVPDGMKLVVRIHRMPINILLIGDDHETSQVQMEVEEK